MIYKLRIDRDGEDFRATIIHKDEVISEATSRIPFNAVEDAAWIAFGNDETLPGETTDG